MLNALVYLCLIAGAALIVYAMFILKDDGGSKITGFDMEEALEAMDKSINDADNTATELVKLSQDVVNEIDDKYQQLLYLYSLIDEKSENLSNTAQGSVAASTSSANSIDYLIDDSYDFSDKKAETNVKLKKKGIDPNLVSDKYRSVFELHKKGNTVAEIARTLNIGQGEVMLVLELGKGR
ncbi:hypothetical protein LJB89_04725 [Tyzzerella sp. OttesenSCG-928-J15]|nr:hypothetical protein [Tyzzerella sp. OttesenSCG-928-J15]